MTLLILSFAAGILTAAAPCILPLLPVIVGGSLVRNDGQRDWYRPLIIAGSLAASVVLFTLLLKASTMLLGVPQMIWQLIAASIIGIIGLSMLMPDLWERIPGINALNLAGNRMLSKSHATRGRLGDVLLGASLGPVFSSCSPTYAFVVAAVLPSSLITGLAYLTAYAVGLAGTLLVIAYAGQSAARRLGWLSRPGGTIQRIIGGLFILVAILVGFGVDKRIQTEVLERGWFDPIIRLEQSVRL